MCVKEVGCKDVNWDESVKNIVCWYDFLDNVYEVSCSIIPDS
jgi:hypothetical protein